MLLEELVSVLVFLLLLIVQSLVIVTPSLPCVAWWERTQASNDEKNWIASNNLKRNAKNESLEASEESKTNTLC